MNHPEDRQEPAFIVEPTLPAREVHLIVAPPGAGKTTFGLQLMHDWEQGYDVLEGYSHPQPYCLLALRDSKDSVRRTLKRVGFESGMAALVSRPTLPPVERDGAFRALHEIVEHPQIPSSTRVLFVDDFWRLVPGGRIDDLGVVSELITDATRICKRRGLTIIGTVLSTNRKNPEELWQCCAETVVTLKPDPDCKETRWVGVSPRNEPRQVLRYRLDDRGRFVRPLTGRFASVSHDARATGLGPAFDDMPPGTELTRADLAKFRTLPGRPGPANDDWVDGWIIDKVHRGELEKPRGGVYAKLPPPPGGAPS